MAATCGGSALPQPLAQILHLRTWWFHPSQLVAFFLHPLAIALCGGGAIQYVSDQNYTHTYVLHLAHVLAVTGCTSCVGGIIIIIYVLYSAYLCMIFVFSVVFV